MVRRSSRPRRTRKIIDYSSHDEEDEIENDQDIVVVKSEEKEEVNNVEDDDNTPQKKGIISTTSNSLLDDLRAAKKRKKSSPGKATTSAKKKKGTKNGKDTKTTTPRRRPKRTVQKSSSSSTKKSSQKKQKKQDTSIKKDSNSDDDMNNAKGKKSKIEEQETEVGNDNVNVSDDDKKMDTDDENGNNDTYVDDDVEEKDDKDDDEDDDEYQEEREISPKKRTTPRGGKRTGGAPASARSKRSRYGPVKDRTCPYCGKVFSIVTGLAYHIEHRVCQRSPDQTPERRKSSISPRTKKSPTRACLTTKLIGTKPYAKLKPGEQFITPYGIVEVVSDSRAPEDHGTTPISEEYKDAIYKYGRKSSRIQERKERMLVYDAKKQRQRRDRLQQMYLKGAAVVAREVEEEERANAPPLDSSLPEFLLSPEQKKRKKDKDQIMAEKTWELYCTLTSAPNILSGLWSSKNDYKETKEIIIESHPWNVLGDHPAEPKDSYPDRIVECILIPDERRKVFGLDAEKEGEGRITRVKTAKASLQKARQDLLTKSSSQSKEVEEDRAALMEDCGAKLFLQRRLLYDVYNPNLSLFQCPSCGIAFNSRMGLKGHIDDRVCQKRFQREKKEIVEDRCTRIKEIDSAINEDIKPLSPLVSIPKPGESSVKRKKRRKKGKKFPAWLVFCPEHSSIYPEVFKAIEFKRGSNNTKFMKKKAEVSGPGRKRARKSRVGMNQAVPLTSLYPGVYAALFSAEALRQDANQENIGFLKPKIEDNEDMDIFGLEDLLAGEPSLDMPLPPLPQELPPLPQATLPQPILPQATLPQVLQIKPIKSAAKPSPKPTTKPVAKPTTTPIEKEEGKGSKKKKKRKKSPVANPKPPPTILIDIKPLGQEVRAGRYPSMTVYNGERSGICCLCKRPESEEHGKVYNCEFCGNSEHIKCVKSKINMRDPEPDDEFMCHKCIQIVMSRRTRAEKRRLQKLDESMGLTETSGSGTETGFNSFTTLNAAMQAASKQKREVVWSQTEFDSHIATYRKCPNGGPGGLICCKACSASYSRLLSKTGTEMEVQTTASTGNEVSELMVLLRDAQIRLKQSVDVSSSNNKRRSLLEKEEVEIMEHNKKRKVDPVSGIMDLFS